ncbi:MAG: putative lipid II flippase FtsW [Firmicutes bacterium]|jgi:cell division protein FtsW|nr:putative lipid II flippase FtsW [Bacillota bacterium]MBR6503356.1 putative lipid II flippase FtsW [Bacillota bacterium]
MSDRNRGDFILIFTVAVLVIAGIVMVFSASYYTALNTQGDPYYYLKRDIIWALLGSVLMFVASKLSYKIYNRWALTILIVGVILLLLVFTPFGVSINGARRWIGVAGFTIMPGELAKPAVAIFTASFISKKPEVIHSLKEGILPLLVIMAVMSGLILKQPNMSTAVTVAGIMVIIMMVGGMRIPHLIGLTAVGFAAGGALMVMEPYRWKRFTSFLDPFADALGTGFQVVQSLLALGSGGLFGVGIGKSIQKTLYLPEPMNDFIFAIIGEETGYLGCMFFLFLYTIFVWRGIHIAIKCKDLFGTLLAAGLTSMIAIQVVLNIAVVTSSMMPTGIALPFVSWGGNSLAISMGCAGILVNISKNALRY